MGYLPVEIITVWYGVKRRYRFTLLSVVVVGFNSVLVEVLPDAGSSWL